MRTNRHRARARKIVGALAAVALTCGAATTASAGADDRASDPDATVTFSYAIPGGTFDPAKANWTSLAFLRPVYDTLMVRTEAGTIDPGLATEWEFDGDDLVITLREGVVFHDGTPFDAEAVKANLDRQLTVDGGTQKSLLDNVESVEVVDASTVRINLTGGQGVIVPVLTTFPGMMVSPAAFESDLATTMVGTGPYRLVSADLGVEIVYERFEDAWQPEQASAAELRIITQPDAGQRLNQMKSGDADAANMDPNLIEDAESAGMQVLAKSTDNMWAINLNTTRPALESADARRAISLAIDREALVEGLDFGFGAASSQVIPADDARANPDITPAYDIEEARALAESSGLAGETLVFLGSAIPTIVGYQEAIQAMLGEAGINVEIRNVDSAQTPEALADGDWDLYMNFYPGSADPWITFNALFGPDSIWYPGDAPEAVVELMAAAEAEADQEARVPIFHELAQAVDGESLIVVIAHPQRPVVANADVTGFQGNVFGVPQLRGTGRAAE